METTLTLDEFIELYGINHAFASGFKNHLRIEGNATYAISYFIEEYQKCWGRNLSLAATVKTLAEIRANAKTESINVETGDAQSLQTTNEDNKPLADNTNQTSEISIPVGANVEINMSSGEVKVKSEEDANIKRRK